MCCERIWHIQPVDLLVTELGLLFADFWARLGADGRGRAMAPAERAWASARPGQRAAALGGWCETRVLTG